MTIPFLMLGSSPCSCPSDFDLSLNPIDPGMIRLRVSKHLGGGGECTYFAQCQGKRPAEGGEANAEKKQRLKKGCGI